MPYKVIKTVFFVSPRLPNLSEVKALADLVSFREEDLNEERTRAHSLSVV